MIAPQTLEPIPTTTSSLLRAFLLANFKSQQFEESPSLRAYAALRATEGTTTTTNRGQLSKRLRTVHIARRSRRGGSGPATLDVEMAQNISEEEFERLLPHLQPHLGRLNLQGGAGKAVLTTGEKSRHILEKIRVTDECQVPEFEIGQQLKEQTIAISELQLLQIAPSVRQQLSRLMQCRLRAKTQIYRSDIVQNRTQGLRETHTSQPENIQQTRHLAAKEFPPPMERNGLINRGS
ncbi:uncharacterized protein FTOL_02147 [Fusarium torulosum]|uniref:Uncharacterized protein n=1 Tax=Fusarium torulosum TaxID=33205 RepID=A0AAE8SEI7_9HYPO|nr:uncharacterized protein FTOL_02147 [Fusarium torulosum]